jgi:hypothetical protein
MKNLLVLVMGFALSTAALASDRIGNGGDVIVCAGGIEMLDAYQARTSLKLTLDPAVEGLGYEAIVNYHLDRLAMVNPGRAKMFREWFRSFEQEAERLSGITLVDIPDTGAQAIPAGCELKQAAVQRAEEDRLPGEYRYILDQDLWNGMNEFTRAALVLHELGYRERLMPAYAPTYDTHNGKMDLVNARESRYVRYFNAHLLSKELLTTPFLRIAFAAELRGGDDLNGRPAGINSFRRNSARQAIWSVDAYLDGGLMSMNGLGFDQFEGRACKKFSLEGDPVSGPPVQFIRTALWGCTGSPFLGWVKVNGEVAAGQLGLRFLTLSKDGQFYGTLAEDFSMPQNKLKCKAGQEFSAQVVGYFEKAKQMLTCKDLDSGKVIWQVEYEEASTNKNGF